MSRHFVAPSWRGWCSPVFAVAMFAAAGPVAAQTDYFNTDRGRPLYVQDATAIERYAFELQLAPQLHWSRPAASTGWGIEPAIAYGILNRTQVELALPTNVARGSTTDLSVEAVHLAVLHALNTETLGLPALAIELMGEVPMGDFAPSPYAGVGLAMTRTMPFGRMHVNAEVTTAEAADAPHGAADAQPAEGHAAPSRWVVGLGLDRALPIRALLLGAEVVAFKPVGDETDTRTAFATGFRYQADPRWVLDAGVRYESGHVDSWSLTFGVTRSIGWVRNMGGGR